MEIRREGCVYTLDKEQDPIGTARLADALCRRKGIRPAGPEAVPLSHAAFQEREFDRLAAAVRGALDMEAIYRMMED